MPVCVFFGPRPLQAAWKEWRARGDGTAAAAPWPPHSEQRGGAAARGDHAWLRLLQLRPDFNCVWTDCEGDDPYDAEDEGDARVPLIGPRDA
eukprot:gene55523-20671_t